VQLQTVAILQYDPLHLPIEQHCELRSLRLSGPSFGKLVLKVNDRQFATFSPALFEEGPVQLALTVAPEDSVVLVLEAQDEGTIEVGFEPKRV
jgi:hypothetical protein